MAKRFTIAQIREANVYAMRGSQSLYVDHYSYRDGAVYEHDILGAHPARRIPTKDWFHMLDCPCKFCRKEP